MKKSTIVLSLLLYASVLSVIYLLAARYEYRAFAPDWEDQMILGEMTVMVLNSQQYKDITAKETVHAVKQGVNRFNSGSVKSANDYQVAVITDRMTYNFTCEDDACSSVSNGSWGGDLYGGIHPVLPLDRTEAD